MIIPVELRSLYKLACESNSTVLITGEAGVGKSSLARDIHRESRQSKNLQVFHLPSLHEGELESLFFEGHRKEGVREYICMFGREPGTWVLDGLEALSIKSQAILLKALSKYGSLPEAVGGPRFPRMIATAHSRILVSASQGLFNPDLLNFFKTTHIPLPAVQERWWDFNQILHECLSDITDQLKKPVFKLAEDAALTLESYSWPGNLRELRQVLEFAVLSARNRCLTQEDLPPGFNRKRRELGFRSLT